MPVKAIACPSGAHVGLKISSRVSMGISRSLSPLCVEYTERWGRPDATVAMATRRLSGIPCPRGGDELNARVVGIACGARQLADDVAGGRFGDGKSIEKKLRPERKAISLPSGLTTGPTFNSSPRPFPVRTTWSTSFVRPSADRTRAEWSPAIPLTVPSC